MSAAAVNGYVILYLFASVVVLTVAATMPDRPRRRLALHPQRFAFRCDRHLSPIYGADRDTPEAAALDWAEHDVREHQGQEAAPC